MGEPAFAKPAIGPIVPAGARGDALGPCSGCGISCGDVAALSRGLDCVRPADGKTDAEFVNGDLPFAATRPPAPRAPTRAGDEGVNEERLIVVCTGAAATPMLEADMDADAGDGATSEADVFESRDERPFRF